MLARLAIAGALLLASAACALAAPCTYVERGWGPAGTVAIRTERIATGLEVPWAVGFLPGGDALVTERPGRVRLLHGGRLEPGVVATVRIARSSEGGLLGLAVDPRFTENRRFYVYYTGERDGRPVNRIARWVLAADLRSAREDRVILDGIAAARFHDGGRIRFGPDGFLYVGTGDATSPSSAQDPASPNGKILRLTPDGGVPAGNPIAGSPVFASGLRNVEAFDWDGAGRLVIAEHGPSGEMGRTGNDRVLVARGGENFGWPEQFGCEAKGRFDAPLLAFREAMPPGGGSVYRGEAIPGWKGSFLVGTLGSRHLHRVALAEDGHLAGHEVYLQGDAPDGLGRIRDVVSAPDGSLWVTTSNCDGRGTCPPEKDGIVRISGR